MTLFLTDTHKDHLSFLCHHEAEILQSFAKASIDYISKGPNLRNYANVAERFNVSAEKIQDALESFVYILVECSKFNVEHSEFKELLVAAGFNEKQCQVLLELYKENKNVIGDIFEKSDNLQYFYDLQWRFESKIGSRALLDQVTPLITINLKLGDSEKSVTTGKIETSLLQTDPSTLVHLTETLERALHESRPHNIRKIEKKIRKMRVVEPK